MSDEEMAACPASGLASRFPLPSWRSAGPSHALPVAIASATAARGGNSASFISSVWFRWRHLFLLAVPAGGWLFVHAVTTPVWRGPNIAPLALGRDAGSARGVRVHEVCAGLGLPSVPGVWHHRASSPRSDHLPSGHSMVRSDEMAEMREISGRSGGAGLHPRPFPRGGARKPRVGSPEVRANDSRVTIESHDHDLSTANRETCWTPDSSWTEKGQSPANPAALTRRLVFLCAVSGRRKGSTTQLRLAPL